MAVDDGVYLAAKGASLALAAPGVLANDPGAASLTAILSRDVENGTLSLSADGSFSYLHDGSATVSDSFSYRASDGTLVSAEVEVRIAVTAAQGATLEVPGDYPSIQEALDAASSGDLVLLAPGLYQEALVLTKAVTLASWFATTGDESYIETTVLDGMDRAAAIEVPSGAEDGATIAGLTIQNADDGLSVRAKIHLVRNRIRWTSDGVDYEDGSGGTCRYNLFEENSDDGIDPDSAVDVVIEHNTIRNNGGDGIEIRLQPYTGPTLDYVIRHNRIYGNQEDGIQLIDYDRITNRRFEISHNAIYDNAQAGLGMMSGANTRENYEGASIQERIYVIGNTFWGNNHGMTGGDNAVVLNNLFVGHPALALKNVDGNSEVAFNLFHDNGTLASNANLDAATTFSADPLLGADLNLVAESPAIDAGTAFYTWQGLTVLDLDPTEYGGAAPDLGAFEWIPGRIGPEAPTLVEPLEGAANVSLTPTLRWLGAGDSFELQIATSADFVAADRIEEVAIPGSALEYTPSFGVLGHAGSYFWRVRGVDATGTGSWSAIGSYSTAAASGPPEAPLLLSPLDGALDVEPTPTLEWLAVAEGFEVQLASDPWFASLVLDVLADARSFVPPPGALSHATPYYWRVRGQNAFGAGPWSAASDFETEPLPLGLIPASNLRSPSQSATTIDLEWSPSPDPRVVAYRIYRDGAPIASESEPHHMAVELGPSSLQRFEVTALDEAGNESLATEELAVWTVEPTISLSLPVSASEDDAEERILLGGAVSLTSTDLEMTEDQTRLQVLGIRFRGVGAPWQAQVRGARIQFTAARAVSVPTSLVIEGEASDDAPPFVQSNGDVSSRPKTSQSVSWEPPPWTSAGAWGSEQRTPELTDVVQEIVDRPGWSPGNAMAFLVSGSGQRAALAYDGGPGGAATLELEYLEACTADADGDGFECATDCDDGDATAYPGALEVCDGRDNDCDNSVDESDASDAAQWFADFDGDGYGDPGQTTRACSQPPAWVPDSSDCNDTDASAFPGASEACNGRDDDCDGSVDEDLVSQSTSCGVGACGATGSTSCVAGTVVDSCEVGPPGPADVSCNGVDDDCDGFVDEEFPPEACVSGQPGVCDAGATSCQAGAIVCVARAPASNDASCNGLDDDCDGSVDEEYVSQATSCGMGACLAAGSTSCVAGAVVDSCEAGVGAPRDASCDGVDDDCDGSTDEDYLAPPTSCGVGECSAQGALECLAGTLVDSCEDGIAALNDAICNGLDDDCDGSIDEDYVSQATSCGVGACRATGSSSCVAAAVVDSCEAGMALVADTTCDGVDDDCDGFVDEEFSPESCATGQLGICSTGVTSCQAGVLLCLPDVTPALGDAICNGLDDDCDGSVDEDYLPETTSCGVGACQAAGSTSCVGAVVIDSCEPGTALLSDTSCNGVDDDCDGSVDEEYAPQSCGTGEPGICAAGTLGCEGGVEECQADRLAEAEVCDDGLDNDCDGAVDLLEDADCADCRERPDGAPCYHGDPETQAWCQAGECIAVPEPGAASGWLALALLGALARRRQRRGVTEARADRL